MSNIPTKGAFSFCQHGVVAESGFTSIFIYFWKQSFYLFRCGTNARPLLGNPSTLQFLLHLGRFGVMKRITDSKHYFVTACMSGSRPVPTLLVLEGGLRAVLWNHRLLFNKIMLNLEHKPCSSLAELSRELHISRRTIQNAVNKVAGKKFTDLRDEVLVERVKSLLASAPNAAIKEVSFEAGYRSPSAFARAVRRACGLSPGQLRARVLREVLAQKD